AVGDVDHRLVPVEHRKRSVTHRGPLAAVIRRIGSSAISQNFQGVRLADEPTSRERTSDSRAEPGKPPKGGQRSAHSASCGFTGNPRRLSPGGATEPSPIAASAAPPGLAAEDDAPAPTALPWAKL